MTTDRSTVEVISNLETAALTLDIINENGELCKDGVRSVNFLQLLANHLISEIEKEGDIQHIADTLHNAYVEVAGTHQI